LILKETLGYKDAAENFKKESGTDSNYRRKPFSHLFV